jgi:hypothetical protein
MQATNGSERGLAVGGTYGFEEIRRMAESVAKSGLFPSAKTTEQAFTLMMLCQAEGLHPMQALKRYHVIEGRPSMKADAMLGDFQAKGGKVDWKEYTHDRVMGIFHAPGLVNPVEVAWTMEDAKKAGLAGKNNWRQYPRAMLKARVISDGVRMAMPEVVSGIYTPEEVGDFVDTTATREPVKAEIPAPKPGPVPEPPPAPTAAELLGTAGAVAFIPHEVKKFQDKDTKRVYYWIFNPDGIPFETDDVGYAGSAKEAKQKGWEVNVNYERKNDGFFVQILTTIAPSDVLLGMPQ